MTVTTSKDQRIGLSRIVTARCYLATLKIVIVNRSALGDDRDLTALPANMLAGFVVELFLKGYLILKGVSPADAKGHGHQLEKLLDNADHLSLGTVTGLSDLVTALAGHEDFTHRYIDPGDEFADIAWEKGLPILDALNQAVEGAVQQVMAQ